MQVVTQTGTGSTVAFSGRAEVADAALVLGQTPSRVREGMSIRKIFQVVLQKAPSEGS